MLYRSATVTYMLPAAVIVTDWPRASFTELSISNVAAVATRDESTGSRSPKVVRPARPTPAEAVLPNVVPSLTTLRGVQYLQIVRRRGALTRVAQINRAAVKHDSRELHTRTDALALLCCLTVASGLI
ncbi:hypothetical protein ACVWWN_003935 [Mycobacterium sp. URHB0021]